MKPSKTVRVHFPEEHKADAGLAVYNQPLDLGRLPDTDVDMLISITPVTSGLKTLIVTFADDQSEGNLLGGRGAVYLLPTILSRYLEETMGAEHGTKWRLVVGGRGRSGGVVSETPVLVNTEKLLTWLQSVLLKYEEFFGEHSNDVDAQNRLLEWIDSTRSTD